MTIPKIWPKPIPRLFFRYQIFRNQYRDFFPIPNFSETETDTFFPIPKILKPKPRLLFDTKFSETETDTFFSDTKFLKPKSSKNWQKSRDRDQNQNFWILRGYHPVTYSVKVYTKFPTKLKILSTFDDDWQYQTANLLYMAKTEIYVDSLIFF